MNRKYPAEITREGVERLGASGGTTEGGSTLNTAFRAHGGFYFYKAQPIRPKALKANRTLTLLKPAELLLLPLELLGAGELVELGFEVEVGPAAEELNVTPCTELDKAQQTADRT